MQQLDLGRIFTYHPPRENQIPRYAAIRRTAREFAELIVEYTPTGRERSLALTAVQEAAMWANAAIAIGESFLEPTEEGASHADVPGPTRE